MHQAVGRNQTLIDRLDPARVMALHATLGLEGSSPAQGDEAPPFYHHLWFWEPLPQEALGRDGHPKPGGFIPDLGLPRRMWAGGRLSFQSPLRIGLQAEKHSEIVAVEHKDGRSGPLGFVTLRHSIRQSGQLCVVEEQDLVYRAESRDGPVLDPPQAPDDVAAEQVTFTTTQLFRYSALTMNGHRIHYDETYARQVEGYDGLVVHGPLLAQLLILRAAKSGPLRQFSFRARSALMHHEAAVLCQKDTEFWVRGPDGRLCMTAQAAW